MTNIEEKRQYQLYVVATPIGNKHDLSARAVEVLKKVDLIACEDCRTSAALLDFYGIDTKLVSYHKFNEKQRTQEFLNLIEQGKTIALISDAGTPCISDPGRILVKELWENNIEITSVSGACAIITLLSQIPRDTEEFAFAGFLPRVKTQQEKVFEKYRYCDVVFYESANRLIETLENLANYRGEDTKIAVGRELTKLFEEVKVGSVNEILEYYKNNILKGEIAVVIYGETSDSLEDADLNDKIIKLQKAGYSDKDVSKILSALLNVNKNKIYETILNMKKQK